MEIAKHAEKVSSRRMLATVRICDTSNYFSISRHCYSTVTIRI